MTLILAVEVKSEQFHAAQQWRQTGQQLAVVGKRLSTETDVVTVLVWQLTDVRCSVNGHLGTRSLSQSRSCWLSDDAEPRWWTTGRHSCNVCSVCCVTFCDIQIQVQNTSQKLVFDDAVPQQSPCSWNYTKINMQQVVITSPLARSYFLWCTASSSPS